MQKYASIKKTVFLIENKPTFWQIKCFIMRKLNIKIKNKINGLIQFTTRQIKKLPNNNNFMFASVKRDPTAINIKQGLHQDHPGGFHPNSSFAGFNEPHSQSNCHPLLLQGWCCLHVYHLVQKMGGTSFKISNSANPQLIS